MKRMMLVLSSREEDNRVARKALKRVASLVEVTESNTATRTFEDMDLPLPALVYEPRRSGGGGEFGLESIETFIEHELEEAEAKVSAKRSEPAHPAAN